LENNQIEHFNLYLTQFQTLYYFDVSKNPIKNIPQNVLDGGQDAIRRYQEEKRALARADEPIYASDKSYLAALERIQAAKTQRKFVLDLGNLNLEIIPSAIQDLTELTHLNLKKNQIRDISMLKGFTQLSTLDLSNNRIQDISMLNRFTQLTTLNLQNNKIAGFSLYLQLLPELNYFNISGNLVENIKNMPRF
jgi:Leucine-rich repeat (LRR) protein